MKQVNGYSVEWLLSAGGKKNHEPSERRWRMALKSSARRECSSPECIRNF